MSLFLDSNIPMYLIGKPHPHKVDAHRLIQSAIVSEERLVTNVEVLQEILHRYTAIGRRDMIQPAFDAVLGLVDEVFAIDEVDLDLIQYMDDPGETFRYLKKELTRAHPSLNR